VSSAWKGSRLVAWLLLWLVLAIGFAIAIGRINWTRYYALYRHGLITTAAVLSKEPHQQVRYKYEVNGQAYESTGRPGTSNPPYTEIVPGQSLQITYLPSDPAISCAGSPSQWLRSETIIIAFAIAFGPIFIIFTIQWWIKRLHPSEDQTLHDS
jgi:hypothetical protein